MKRSGSVPCCRRPRLSGVGRDCGRGASTPAPTLASPPAYRNLIVATGHKRAGLQLAPASAEVIGDLVLGRTPPGSTWNRSGCSAGLRVSHAIRLSFVSESNSTCTIRLLTRSNTDDQRRLLKSLCPLRKHRRPTVRLASNKLWRAASHEERTREHLGRQRDEILKNSVWCRGCRRILSLEQVTGEVSRPCFTVRAAGSSGSSTSSGPVGRWPG